MLKIFYEKEHERDDDGSPRLFDLARSDEELPTELSIAERQEVESIRAVLSMIDASWQAAPAEVDRVKELFYRHLAAKYPEHPMLYNSTVQVQTLGDLFKASGDDVPDLPAPARDVLLRDATPIQQLLEPEVRTAVFGKSIRAAQVPKEALVALMNWLNRSVSALTPGGNQSHGLVYTRRQSKKKPSGSDDAKS